VVLMGIGTYQVGQHVRITGVALASEVHPAPGSGPPASD
jgi:hypothetical protein